MRRISQDDAETALRHREYYVCNVKCNLPLSYSLIYHLLCRIMPKIVLFHEKIEKSPSALLPRVAGGKASAS